MKRPGDEINDEEEWAVASASFGPWQQSFQFVLIKRFGGANTKIDAGDCGRPGGEVGLPLFRC